MSVLRPNAKVVRFGLFEANLDQQLLTKAGLRVKLQSQPYQVLALLLERAGEVVTREEIQKKLWPHDTYVEFDDGLNTAIKKLRAALSDSPENPRFIETVPRRGYRFLASVHQAFPASQADPPSLEPSTTPSEIVIAAQERSRGVIEKKVSSSSLLSFSVVASLLLAAVLAGYFFRGRAGSRENPVVASAASAPSVRLRPVVAVMGFRNLSRETEDAWLSTAFSEMLNTELAAGNSLRLVPGEEISHARLDLSLANTEALGKESLERVKSNVGADYVVIGAYTAMGPKGKKRIRLDVRLQDTRSGETIAEDALDRTQEELFSLVSDVGIRLRQRLQAGTLPGDQKVQVQASLPSSVEAARLYADGVGRLHLFDALAARDLLLKAIAVDQSFPMAHSALSAAWTALGYDSKAAQEAKLAFGLAAQLSPEEQLVAEGRYRAANREWPRAIEIYQRLWKSFPDNLEYGLQLASVQSSAGHGKDALATVDTLRALPLGLGENPRIDLEESRDAEMMGDFRRSQQAASRAAAKGRAAGALLIVAQARSDEGWDWDRLGNFDKAAEALTEAKSLFSTAKEYQAAAMATNMMGDVFYDKGDYEQAVVTLNESLATCRAHGFQKCAARSLNALGHIQHDHGDLRAALSTYQEVLRVTRETGISAGEGASLSNIANVLQDMGDLAKAKTSQEESLKVFTAIGDKRGMGATLSNLGNLLDDLGDLPGALSCYERAYKLDEETGYKRGIGFVLENWGRVLLEQNNLPAAGAKLDAALKTRQEMGSPSTIGDSILGLAELELEQGNAPQAEKLARDAVAQFSKVGERDEELRATSLIARSLLAEGKHSEAEALRRSTLSRKTNELPIRFEASLASSAVQEGSGNSEIAEKQLQDLISQLRKLRFVGYELRARLELGSVHMRMGKTATAEAELRSLAADAKSRGYVLIARKSSAAHSKL